MKNLRLVPDFCNPQTIENPTFFGFTLQLLRPSFTTQLLEQGTDLRYIQELLGHNSSKTTELYTQVSVQKIGKIKNPLDDFYKTKSSTIHADLVSIVEQKQKYNGDKHT
jgi:hypothetical protein